MVLSCPSRVLQTEKRSEKSCKHKDFFLKKNFHFIVFSLFLVLSTSIGQTVEHGYIIKPHDTLWDLAFRFLGDPFLWPRLWHANPDIANPNLIYPGNRLILDTDAPHNAQASSVSVNSPSVEAAQSVTPKQDDFVSETKQALEQSEHRTPSYSLKSKQAALGTSYFSDTLFKVAMQSKSYFTSEFLEQIGFLYDGRDAKGLIYPGNAVLKKIDDAGLNKHYEHEAYQPHEEVLLNPISQMHYHPGDTVTIFHSDGLVKFHGRTVNIVRSVAKALILSANADRTSAVLFKMWDVVQSGDRVDTATHFSNLQIDTIIDPASALKGTVFLRIENTEQPYPFQTFILDKGSKDGVMLGDIFSVASGRDRELDKFSALACAVNIKETSSTLVIEKLSGSIHPGDTASVVKRIRFK